MASSRGGIAVNSTNSRVGSGSAQKAGKNFIANIPDDQCMAPDYWIDYTTSSKNDEFIENVKRAKEMGSNAVMEFAYQTMPGWIVDVCDEYDAALFNMSQNWSKFCERFGTPTQKIVLVSYISFNEDKEKTKHRNLTYLCDVLTACGFVVKDKQHFMMCKGCHKLMLSEHAQKTLWCTNNVWKVCRECTALKDVVEVPGNKMEELD